MPTNIRDEILRRIVLAKVLHRAGEEACANKNDQMIFTKGLLLLHDAAENALGAVADHLHARMTGNIYLLDYYDLIAKNDPQGRKPLYYEAMKILNTHRNNAKHQGILPDINSCVHFPATVYELISNLCQQYLLIDFEKASLKSLIVDKKILSFISRAEDEIEKGDISDALISLAHAMYYICDSGTVPWFEHMLKGSKEEMLFTRTEKIEHKVKLLEHGVDPHQYRIFKNLTPKLAWQKDSDDLYAWHDKHYEHPANLTTNNANFCLNFCIETALKFQREKTDKCKLIRYSEIYEDVIEAIHEKVKIWDRSSHPSPSIFSPDKTPKKPQVVLILERGQKIIGQATDSEERLDEWFIMSKDIPSEYPGSGTGFVMKSDVRVTGRNKQLSAE